MLMNRCIICGHEMKGNKKIGFVINKWAICTACEYLITITPVHSSLYDYLKNALKKVIKEPA